METTEQEDTGLLESICFLPPNPDHSRPPISLANGPIPVPRQTGGLITLPSRLFWDAAPWHAWPAVVCQCVSVAAQERGIVVRALHSELGCSEPLETGEKADPTFVHQMVPYRNERYGLVDNDWRTALIVDLQISPQRDRSGRFAYSSGQVSRWQAAESQDDYPDHHWTPTISFPPDVAVLTGLVSKVDQLRELSPQAAVVCSVAAEAIDSLRPAILDAKPDALLVRFEQLGLTGTDLAQWLINLTNDANPVPIWLSIHPSSGTPPITVDDAAKLIAMGAFACAIDPFTTSLVEELSEIAPPASYVSDPVAHVRPIVEEIMESELDSVLERLQGLMQTIPASPGQRLGSFDSVTAERLGLVHLR